ncbi:hypothetical protein D3C86_2171220 [compost metagenome]
MVLNDRISVGFELAQLFTKTELQADAALQVLRFNQLADGQHPVPGDAGWQAQTAIMKPFCSHRSFSAV